MLPKYNLPLHQALFFFRPLFRRFSGLLRKINAAQAAAKTKTLKQKLLLGKKVLLVEDDEVNQMLLKLMIEDQGAEFILEPNLERALEKMLKDEFDLVFLDTQIEGQNALRLTKELNLKIPIIGMSSVDLSGRGLYNGLSHVIRKPVDYRKLKFALRKTPLL